jgi:hypothetical protein
MLQCEAFLLVNIAHSREFNELGQLPSNTDNSRRAVLSNSDTPAALLGTNVATLGYARPDARAARASDEMTASAWPPVLGPYDQNRALEPTATLAVRCGMVLPVSAPIKVLV